MPSIEASTVVNHEHPTLPDVYVSEKVIAKAIGLSIYTLQKDRITEQRIPFTRIGTNIRYSVKAVNAAMALMAVNGCQPKAKALKDRLPVVNASV